MRASIVIAGLVMALLGLGAIRERRLLRSYWQRACTGRIWRRRFPHAPKSEIREFLDIFIEAFGFADRRRLCFSPDDRVMDIYRTLYPVRGSADSMELEDLVESLQGRYRVEVLVVWREDITLGELFTLTRSRGA
jgi:hypothetical protein